MDTGLELRLALRRCLKLFSPVELRVLLREAYPDGLVELLPPHDAGISEFKFRSEAEDHVVRRGIAPRLIQLMQNDRPHQAELVNALAEVIPNSVRPAEGRNHVPKPATGGAAPQAWGILRVHNRRLQKELVPDLRQRIRGARSIQVMGLTLGSLMEAISMDIGEAFAASAEVKVLVCAPDAGAAAWWLRANPGILNRSLEDYAYRLETAVRLLSVAGIPHKCVRIYRDQACYMLRIDDAIYYGPYFPGKYSGDTPTLEIATTSEWGRLALSQYDEQWNAAQLWPEDE